MAETYKAIGTAFVCSIVYDVCNRILRNVCNGATRLHGVTIQNTKSFTVTYVRTSQPAFWPYKLVATNSFMYHHLHGQQITRSTHNFRHNIVTGQLPEPRSVYPANRVMWRPVSG